VSTRRTVPCFYCGTRVETSGAYLAARVRQPRLFGDGRELERYFHAACFRHFARLGGRPMQGAKPYEVLEATQR
jgi:hypothetical protein